MKSARLPFAASVLCLVTVAGAARAETPRTYVGTKKCGTCHPRELASWRETRMAKAFDYLKPGAAREAKVKAKLDPQKDYTTDKSCVACHTTGFEKQGGFVDMATTPDMAGIGCEDCHGAGSDYLPLMRNKAYKRAALVAAGLVDPITKEQCASCHNTKMPVGTMVGSRHFIRELAFDSGKLKGTHAKFALKATH